MAFSIASTLEKMNSRDKDFRYMATADLVVELGKDTFKMDADSEKKLTQMVLKLLEDNSNQVQELAVKCLGPLSKRVKEQQISDIIDTLSTHLLTEKKGTEELRDISSIGLKTVITEIPLEPAAVPALIVKRLAPKLLSGISQNEDKPDTVSYCLEALNDLLGRFGSLMTADHEKILKVVQPQLNSKRNATRKKAISCLGHLAVTIPDNLFTELINHLIQQVSNPNQKADQIKTHIQAIGAISRPVGYRLGKFLKDICPIIIRYSEDTKKSDDELRENCFQCFESLVFRCPKEITPFLDSIINLCLKYIKYDPNYSEDDNDEMDTDEQEEEEEEDDQQEDYSDDDDVSWKVRRSSAKCLSAIIVTRPDMLQVLYTQVAPVLITRFREREENVKLDIFSTFVDLLKQTSLLSRRNPELSSLTEPLRQLIPKAIAGIAKQLKEKSLKTRGGAFALLRELVTVLPGALEAHVAAVVPGIQFSLGVCHLDKHTNSNLKIETLSFVRIFFATHNPAVFHPHIKALATPIFKSIKDPYYRTSAEALRAACELVHILRPKGGSSFDHKPYVNDLFNATLEKLKTQDIDQEVKESAITCTGLIVANLGDELKGQLPEVLSILLDRLSNEITRLTAVKALENIAVSPLHVDLSPVLAEVIKELSSFLRKTNRQLRQSSLSALGVLVKNYGTDKKAADLFKNVLTEVAPLINDADLHLTHLALALTVSILQAHSASAANLSEQILPRSFDLFKSSLLQGLALESLLSLLSELAKINAKNASYDVLLNQLITIASAKDLSKQVLLNIAKGIAALSVQNAESQKATVSRFIKDLSKPNDLLALYSLGEIGRRTDLSSHDSLQKSVLACFDSAQEETRQAASFALGNIAVGNLKAYLPHILDEIKKNPKIKYLLLHSMREIIVRQSASTQGVEALHSYQKDILNILFEECQNDEEGTRNVVAECLGKLAVISPSELVPVFSTQIKSDNANTRSTIVTALKFAIVERSQPIDHLLQTEMSKYLDLLKDKDLNVRRNTLLTLNYAAHNKPILIREILPTYLPLIYLESKVKPELIREVDLGPFKHKVDDGLEVRKAAFECMYTLLDTCLDRVNIPNFIVTLVDGLKDHYDIKMLADLMLIRLSYLAGPALLESLDQLVEPLRSAIGTKAKEGAPKQDVERNDELIRSTLRAVAAITKVPNAESNLKFEEFLRTTIKTPDLLDKFNAIVAETASAADSMDLS